MVARTNTLKAIETGALKTFGENTDVCTRTQHLQAYDPAKINDRIKKAVEMTRGKVILYHGDFIQALFSACCGGTTATTEESFPRFGNETSYFYAAPCPCLNYAPEKYRQWELELPMYEIQNIFGWDTGDVSNFGISKQGQSGRAATFKAGNKEMEGPQFRSAVGNSRRKSLLITQVNNKDDAIKFSGRGWGSGVGFCQWGGYGLAKEGKNHEEIIKYYFKDVEITKLWE